MSARRLRNRSSAAAFLCYHSIAPAGPRYLTISAELFERQLATLRRRGFRGGDLAALEELAAGRSSGRTAFLTFDDGFRDNFETALPLLREYGFAAFVFVLPPLLEDGGAFEWPEMRADLGNHGETMRSVTWPMLEQMAEGGFEVGSHTLSHLHLPGSTASGCGRSSGSRGRRSSSAWEAATRSPTPSASGARRSPPRLPSAATASPSRCRRSAGSAWRRRSRSRA